MARWPKTSNRSRRDLGRTILCRHGVIYPVSTCALAAVFVPTPRIVEQLSRIEDVRFVAADGECGNVLYPPIRLLEVAAVLEPLVGEPPVGAAARRGRLW